MSLAWRFPHSARLDSTHAGLPLDACDVPAATSNHSHPAFLLVVEDVFVSFPAGYGVHVFQHGFSVHMSHLHSRKDTVSMHLHALSWFCSSLVAAANWRFKFLRSSFSHSNPISRGRWGCSCRGVCISSGHGTQGGRTTGLLHSNCMQSSR